MLDRLDKQEKTARLLSSSIKNLRENLNELSMDGFIGKTIETLMLIERDEYLEKLGDIYRNDA